MASVSHTVDSEQQHVQQDGNVVRLQQRGYVYPSKIAWELNPIVKAVMEQQRPPADEEGAPKERRPYHKKLFQEFCVR